MDEGMGDLRFASIGKGSGSDGARSSPGWRGESQRRGVRETRRTLMKP
ncbi:hypothetical protein GCM10010464_67410 [Pseudonocardia yunnanensis]